MQKPLFINGFQKGTQQNSNLGIGAVVGFDVYSKPGCAILGKAISSTYTFVSLNEYATYMDISNSSSGTPSIAISGRIWCQTSLGTVYYSDNYGVSWNLPSYGSAVPSGNGNGLIVYQNYVFIFFNSQIWYAIADAASPNFVVWKTTIDTGTQVSATSPINENHFPYLFPNNRGVYFANNNCVGFFGQVFPVGATTPTIFNPAGALNTDYQYTNIILSLPSNYAINTLDYLPPSNLAIGANNIASGQEADITTWDTISANKFSAPIKIFSGVNINGSQGIKQLVNRLNVVYAVVGGNHALYSTNGGTANIIADFSLYSNIRTSPVNANGQEYPLPTYFNSFPSAIAVSGNKILTGVATSSNNSYYPAVNTGAFPCGVWSIYFNNDGSTVEQMEYSINFLNGGVAAVSTFVTTGDNSAITVIRPLPNGQLAVGYKSTINGATQGQIAIFDNVAYIADKTYTSLESELFEIGTALEPQVPNNIEINLLKKLLTGQQIEISYRTSTDQNWTIIQTFSGDGTVNYYSIQQHGIGATQFLEIRCRANTGSPNLNDTPMIKSIKIS